MPATTLVDANDTRFFFFNEDMNHNRKKLLAYMLHTMVCDKKSKYKDIWQETAKFLTTTAVLPVFYALT